ncbi:Golgi phosphoprotein 3 GPP34 [Micromonospora sp. Llam0]|uniref:GOLPH3/VPS74 family protein n=1 Tax=Micromonospora sp. Llam0 TaxID=2485143 RepID=UPI000FB5C590|nr:GPP34 family phosphoprotein [Micromonospora sp. Llam0]ROO60404.1 Golgi phosphoprotein 3 GPP34 [Micromonospora sp. Llam0]
MTVYRSGAPRRSALSLPVDRRLLADEFFLMAHHDVSGQSRLAPRIAGFGVAAAVLADLVVAGVLTVTPAGHLACPPPAVRVRGFERQVAAWVAAEPDQPVPVWLEVLAEASVPAIGQRLADAGVVRPVRIRRLMTSRTVWAPADINVAAWPWARLSTRIRCGELLDPFDSALARLCIGTGVEGRFLDGEPQARQRLDELLSPVPVQVDALLVELSAAVGRAVLGGRT